MSIAIYHQPGSDRVAGYSERGTGSDIIRRTWNFGKFVIVSVGQI
jgi:hypothetical protein